MNGQPQNTPPLAALSPAERARALERYRILKLCVENDVPLTHVARYHGIALRTVQRWLAQYRRDGFAGWPATSAVTGGIHTGCILN